MAKRQQQQQMKKEQETLATVMMVAAQDLTSLLVVSGSMTERYCLCLVQECCHLNWNALYKTSISAKDLTVDPAAIRACKEGYRIGDILRLAEAFQGGVVCAALRSELLPYM